MRTGHCPPAASACGRPCQHDRSCGRGNGSEAVWWRRWSHEGVRGNERLDARAENRDLRIALVRSQRCPRQQEAVEPTERQIIDPIRWHKGQRMGQRERERREMLTSAIQLRAAQHVC
jgi:hypothetical protein